MNLQNDFTKTEKILQEHSKMWDQKILPYFPKNLDQTGVQSGALQRKRGIHSIYDLLKIFFFTPVRIFPFVFLQQRHVLLVYALFPIPPCVKGFQKQHRFSKRFFILCCPIYFDIRRILF